ncbi:MAG: ROK family protein [Planctomycetes bacterium]|nr:ROK family protein [Planctomycetota bacterium]
MTSTQVGIDLGGTAAKSGRVTHAGEILAERTIDPGFARGPQAVLDTLAQLFHDLGGGDSLGIGVPGLIDRERGYVHSSPNLPGFVELDVKGELARRVGLPREQVHVENDANAAAVGELWLGAGRGERDALVVTLGTGIGGGLILGGELFAGAGMGGEVGHVVIDPRGPQCGCGKLGCVEAYASATAAKRRALAAQLPADKPGDLVLLAQRARDGHEPEARLMREIGRDLGRGLGPVLCLLDLRTFIFGGGFSGALDVLEPGIREGIEERSYGGRAPAVKLLRATLGPAAGWIGAARVAMTAREALRSRS